MSSKFRSSAQSHARHPDYDYRRNIPDSRRNGSSRHDAKPDVSILADAVDVGVFGPPDGGLYQVVFNQGVTLVQVGHRAHKPSVGRMLAVPLRGVRIAHGSGAAGALHELRVVVEPVLLWQVLEQEVVRSAVIEHQVHHHLDAMLMAVGHQLSVLLVGAQAWVDAVVVRDGVTVVRAAAVVCIPLHQFSGCTWSNLGVAARPRSELKKDSISTIPKRVIFTVGGYFVKVFSLIATQR